ncbi:LTA synthase family protein [Virgibacillus flavescens]|uniref:LTA synthase family protein n=1 Tax=Virgibacillus flavescens TaxID=1611422 RepID=UPI003D33CBA5
MNQIKRYISQNLIKTTIVSLWLKTVLVTLIGFSLTAGNALDILLLLIGPVGTLMLLIGLSFFFSKRVRPYAVLVIYILVTILLYSNLLYYRFYIDFVTVSVLMQLSNVGGLGASTAELLSPWDILIFIDIFVIGWVVITKRKKREAIHMPAKKKFALTGVVLIAVTIGLGLIQNPHLLSTAYDRQQLVKSFGLYNYQIINAIYGVKAPVEKAFSDEKDAKELVDAYINNNDTKQSELFGLAEGKNVVLISMESTQNFVINKRINGEEITPFLNDLIDDSFYFSNIYDQAAQGKTSDAEFIIGNGLYPLPSGSVYVRRPENTFISLPKILKKNGDYTSVTFHGNDREFWNREQMYKSLGYDQYFSKRDYNVTEENSINYGIKDTPFFEQSMDELANLSEPYFAKFITLSNHFPFLIDNEDQFIAPADTEVDVVNRYVTTVRYMDESLKKFFQMLKEQNMYEDTIFVLYGDHYGISKKYEEGVHDLLNQEATALNHLELQQIPLIIHVPGHDGGKVIEATGGQIDIRTTLLHLLGISTENTMTFGTDLLVKNHNDPVIIRDGSVITNKYAYINNLCYSRESKKVIARKKCLQYEKIARKQLELSDEIIYGDLLRFRD